MVGYFLAFSILAAALTVPTSYLLIFILKSIIDRRINKIQVFEPIEEEIEYIENNSRELKFTMLDELAEIQKPTEQNYFLPFLVAGLILTFVTNILVYYFEDTSFKIIDFFITTILGFSPVFYFLYHFNIHSVFKSKQTIKLFLILNIAAFLIVIMKSINSDAILVRLWSISYQYYLILIIFVLLHLFKYIRQISHIVFPALFIVVMFFGLTVMAFDNNNNLLYQFFLPINNVLHKLGIGSYSSTVILFLMLMLALTLGIVVTVIIRKAYISKTYNNFLLIVDFVCLFWLGHTILSYRPNISGIFYAIILFAIFKMVLVICFKIFKVNKRQNGQNLLILRVFALGKESEILFNKICSWWKFKGAILLIAGKDVTNTTLDIDDLLTFLSGKMKYRFNTSYEHIERNIKQLDLRQDIDGRYRTNEFYCNNSTWKTVLQKLIPSTDKVIMDLRSFSKRNAGCKYEITELINRVELDKILFIINESTDFDYMKIIMKDSWNSISVNSPNMHADIGTIKIFRYSKANDFDKLMKLYN